MQQLYDLQLSPHADSKELYLVSTAISQDKTLFFATPNETADFVTYFNGFDLESWQKYTTIEEVCFALDLEGSLQCDFVLLKKDGSEEILACETYTHAARKTFCVQHLEGVLLGLRCRSLVSNTRLRRVQVLGRFQTSKALQFTVVLCTFKRETDLLRTVSCLQDFASTHPWLRICVIDNGRTLPEQQTDTYTLLANRNSGGSGGFSKGMHYVLTQHKADYLVLMDDDILLDCLALEKTYALCMGLRKEYQDSFIAGALLDRSQPCIQGENTATWHWFRKTLGQGKDLRQKRLLAQNQSTIPASPNQYAGWWYCAMPTQRVRSIGLPLPFFVRGDDIEYSIRNQRLVLHCNGIAVWHELGQNKQAPWLSYFNNRNMLALVFFVHGGGRMMFFVQVLARLLRHLLKKQWLELHYMALALNDLTSLALFDCDPEEKLAQIRSFCPTQSLWRSLCTLTRHALAILWRFPDYQKRYLEKAKPYWQSSLS